MARMLTVATKMPGCVRCVWWGGDLPQRFWRPEAIATVDWTQLTDPKGGSNQAMKLQKKTIPMATPRLSSIEGSRAGPPRVPAEPGALSTQGKAGAMIQILCEIAQAGERALSSPMALR